MGLLTRQQAAERLNISLSTLDEERRGGHIEYIQRKPNGRVQFTEESIAAYLARATHQATPELRNTRQTYRKRRV